MIKNSTDYSKFDVRMCNMEFWDQLFRNSLSHFFFLKKAIVTGQISQVFPIKDSADTLTKIYAKLFTVTGFAVFLTLNNPH
jgi:hypothetical protein